MRRNARSINLTVCDYDGNALCDLYDNTADLSGQATNVFVRRERNGWKELSFTLPSTCVTAEGIERNYRLDYLIADYKIKTTEDKGNGKVIEDWFIISENKITHSANGRNVDVVAGHISQLLKIKNLGLEFSDTEGNNVGTISQLLETILEGTGWKLGDNIPTFYEDDGQTEKVRSLSAESKTGALRLIMDACEKFDARAEFNGDYTINVYPMNPFSNVKDGEVPEPVMNSEVDVIELYYNRNVHDLSRTLNTENLVTRLYSYGSSGGDEAGVGSLRLATHQEATYKNNTQITAGQEVVFIAPDNIRRYFICHQLPAGTSFTYSLLDFASESYIWDGTRAYEVYLDPKTTTQVSLTRVEIKEVQNNVDYLMDFDYYRKIGLYKDKHLQATANFQRQVPELIAAGMEASSALLAKQREFSTTAETQTPFLRFAIPSTHAYSKGENGAVTIKFDKSNVHPDGILYRSDYDEKRRNYFTWYVAEELKKNGDPKTGVGSIVYIIHTATNPITYERAFIRKIDNQASSFYYSDDKGDPSSITLWLDYDTVQSRLAHPESDVVFLFCTNSNTGRLGVKESAMESLITDLQTKTKIATVEHPTYFVWDNDPAPETTGLVDTYGWYYRLYTNPETPRKLYFCDREKNESSWSEVYIGPEPPGEGNYIYYYNLKEHKVYHEESGAWKWDDDTDSKRLGNGFTTVITLCRKYDMNQRGTFEKYMYQQYGQPLTMGRYAFKDEYDNYYLFSVDRNIPVGHVLSLDMTQGYIREDNSAQDIFPVEAHMFDALTFPIDNELSMAKFSDGDIDENGLETNLGGRVRTNNIDVYPDTVYEYNLHSLSIIAVYDSKKRLIRFVEASGRGSFTTDKTAKSVRIATDGMPDFDAHYFRVQDPGNCVFSSNKQYTLLEFEGTGDKLGIHTLLRKMISLANEIYLTYLPAYKTAEQAIVDLDNGLKTTLGDMYREGYWQKNEYVEGDEEKLYKDSRDALYKIAKPEATYDFTFLDLYKSNHDMGYSVDELIDVEWPDIDENFAVHLVDEDIDVDCWAAVDTIDKCYDQEWQTKLEITTELSTIRQHSFTDALAYIAEVANSAKMKQTIYERAAVLTSAGKLAADRLEGALNVAKTTILGGSSNWYTDPKTGGIVLVSADGSSAMMLTGYGWLLATTKDEYGDFQWRTAASAAGLSADIITAGEMSAERLIAGTITTDKVSSSFGQDLEIGSNKALMLYATVDGYRPAGGLVTLATTGDGRFYPVKDGDSFIEIAAAKVAIQQDGTQKQITPAYINIVSGGHVTLQGSTMDIKASGTGQNQKPATLNIDSGGTLSVKSDGNMEINSGGSLNIVSGSNLTIRSPNFNIYKNNGRDYTDIKGTIQAVDGKIAGFTIGAKKQNGTVFNPATESYDSFYNSYLTHYIYSGQADNINTQNAGIYLGDDGINIGGGKFKFSANGQTAELRVDADKVFLGKITGFNTLFDKISNMDSKTQTAQDTADSKTTTFRCTSTEIVNQPYKAKDTWTCTDVKNINGQNICFYYQYVCTKVSNPRNSTSDWTLTGTALTGGAGLIIDAESGNIDIIASNTVKIVAGSTIDIAANKSVNITTKGTVVIGNGQNPFTIGAEKDERAYIYNGITGLASVSELGSPYNGVYIGTDGINVANMFQVTNGGSLYLKGAVYATALYIGASDGQPGTQLKVDNNGLVMNASSTAKNAVLNTAGIKIDSNGIVLNASNTNAQGAVLKTAGITIDSNGLVLSASKTTAELAKGAVLSTAGIKIDSNGIVLNAETQNAQGAVLNTAGIKVDATTGIALSTSNNNADGSAQKVATLTMSNGKINISCTDVGSGNNSGIKITPSSIDISTSGKFTIQSDNFTIASNGTVEVSGKITATSGKIGPWVIANTYIANDTLNNSKVGMRFASGDSAVAFYAGTQVTGDSNNISSALFKVYNNGKLIAANAEITGTITADHGKIGGWNISEEHIGNGSTKANSSVGLANVTGTEKVFWSGGKTTPTFYVQADGKLYASNAEIAGTITAGSGTIGPWTINATFIGDASELKNAHVALRYKENDPDHVAFFAGAETAADASANLDTAKFKVWNTGKFLATKADIKGSIKATSLYIGATDSGNGTQISVDSDTGIVLQSSGSAATSSKNKIAALTLTNGKIDISCTNVGSGNSSGIRITPSQIVVETTGRFKITSTNFNIDGDGNVSMTGTVTATGGKIGPWILTNTYLADATLASAHVGMRYVSGTNGAFEPDKVAFFAGAEGDATDATTNLSTAKFRVYNNGRIKASDLEITGGTITIKSGSTTNFNVSSTGVLTAISGSVAGWTLSSHRLYSGSGRGYVAMDNDTTLTDPSKSWNAETNDWVQPYAFWCGSGTPTNTNAKFRVRRDGVVYLNALMIWDPDTSSYKEVDFSKDFSDAVSYSSGSWSGTNFKATLSLFGKISKTVSLSASANVTNVTMTETKADNGVGIGTAQILVSVGGAQHSFTDDTSVTINAYPAYKDGYNKCIDIMEQEHKETVYTRSAGPYGGGTVHYYKDGNQYISCGSGWYITTAVTRYTKPDKL